MLKKSLIVSLLLLSACGVRKIETTPGVALLTLAPREIIKNHHATKANFNSLSGRLKIDFKSGKTSQGIPATVRIIKDEGIWISALFGMAKALITPEEVSFYSAINKVYFTGSFQELSVFLGTQIDYNTLQNLLLGETVVPLKPQRSKWSIAENRYRFNPQQAAKLFKLWLDIEPETYELKRTLISEPNSDGSITIDYESYQEISGVSIPESLRIKAQKGRVQSEVNVSYRNISLNRTLKFPYTIPAGFKKLSLKP
jgi:hypothetical protein